MYFVTYAASLTFASTPSRKANINYVLAMVIAITWGWPFCAFLGLIRILLLLLNGGFLNAFWDLVQGTVLSALLVIVHSPNPGPAPRNRLFILQKTSIRCTQHRALQCLFKHRRPRYFWSRGVVVLYSKRALEFQYRLYSCTL